MTVPMHGCTYCSSTGGVNGCPLHGPNRIGRGESAPTPPVPNEFAPSAPIITLDQGRMVERLIAASHLRDASGTCYFCSSSGTDRDGWCKRVRRVEVTATDVNLVFGDR